MGWGYGSAVLRSMGEPPNGQAASYRASSGWRHLVELNLILTSCDCSTEALIAEGEGVGGCSCRVA